MSVLSSYCPDPKSCRFADQQDQEKIKLLLRRHWWTNLKWILITTFMILLPIVFAAFPQVFVFWPVTPKDAKIIFLVAWYFLTAFYLFENFLLWYYNVFLVTDERVLDLDFFGLFNTDSSEAELEQIQDISHSQGGFAQLIFNFGNVYVQTAADQIKIEILGVSKPTEVHKMIVALEDAQDQPNNPGGSVS